MAAGVEQLLADMRKQFDDVHMEVLKQTADFTRFKEGIRQADSAEQLKEQDMTRLSCLQAKLQDMQRRIEETSATRKVYRHILDRTKILLYSQTQLFARGTVKWHVVLSVRALNEHDSHVPHSERTRASPSTNSEDAREIKELPGRVERQTTVRRWRGKSVMFLVLRKQLRIKHRLMSESRALENEVQAERQLRVTLSVIKDAAAAAFSASSGRWRRMYGMEKLIANALQKITVEEVEKSQNTEDTFQKIREATGLDDVMDIVQKFLNKDVEHEQLQHLATVAEARLEQTRAKYTEVLQKAAEETLSGDCGHRRHFYAAAEAQDETLQRAVKQHIASLDALTETTMQLDHAKQWAGRINALFVLAGLEEPFVCESVEGLVGYISAVQKNTLPKVLERLEAQGEQEALPGDAICESATQGTVPPVELSRLSLKEVNTHRRLERSSSTEENSDEESEDPDRLGDNAADHMRGTGELWRSSNYTIQSSPNLLKPAVEEACTPTLAGDPQQPNAAHAEGHKTIGRDGELDGNEGPRVSDAEEKSGCM
uniref:Uncharacterized protein n=3 Tax=Sarcocystidae TaxID=5809 RepID=A0A0F7UMT8_NEOCL|nr:TPA: hypothetical protein BN1204_052255 [Neospora caninum Liverpool]